MDLMKNSNIQSCCHPSGPLRDPSSSGAPSSSISWNLLFSKACHSKDKRRPLSTVHHRRHNHYPSSTTSPTILSIKLFIIHSYLVVVSSHIKHSYRILPPNINHQPSGPPASQVSTSEGSAPWHRGLSEMT